MKRFALIVFSILISTGLTYSQSISKVGFGVSTNFSVTNLGYQNAANVSIDFGNIRIAPFIAMGTSTRSYEPEPNPENYKNNYKENTLLFGANFLFLFQKENSLFYLGSGIGFENSVSSHESISGNYTQKEETDLGGLVIIPTLGGEYMLAPEFALGVEINYQVFFLSGTTVQSATNYSDNKRKLTSDFSTLGAFFTARYFFSL